MSVVKQIIEGDRLFLKAESQAKDFSLFPESARESMKILGIVPQEKIAVETEILDGLTIDAYIERVVSPAEDQKRTAAPEVILDLGKAVERQSEGPYFQAILQMEFAPGVFRNVGIIAQDRRFDLGSWMPQHHLRAAQPSFDAVAGDMRGGEIDPSQQFARDVGFVFPGVEKYRQVRS